ncbi:MAG: MFS transporter [Acidobacteria bacterium]|nr:MAG: MFS transporter [Acidobacteriota bacterium]
MLRSARVSVALVFFIHGVIVANWLSRIPAVQRDLRLPSGVLGLCLLGASAGAFAAIVGLPRVLIRFGSARVTTWSSFALCAVLPLPGLARGTTSLAAALVVYGACAGAMDVAMNTQAVDVERAYRRPVMVAFHALFSFGGMVGAIMGGLAAARDVAPRVHLLAVAVLLAMATALATRRLLPDDPEAVAAPDVSLDAIRPLVALGIIAFCILFGEGAMSDWGAVYLTSYTGQGAAAAGYAVFSLTMAGGRLAGDWLRGRVGSVLLVRLGGALAGLGLGAGLVMGGVGPTLVGYACAGAGFSTIFPITLSAAGHKLAPRSQTGVAAVTAIGYVAFLAGPPAIGMLADRVTLRVALGLTVILSLTAAALAGSARDADAELAAARHRATREAVG